MRDPASGLSDGTSAQSQSQSPADSGPVMERLIVTWLLGLGLASGKHGAHQHYGTRCGCERISRIASGALFCPIPIELSTAKKDKGKLILIEQPFRGEQVCRRGLPCPCDLTTLLPENLIIRWAFTHVRSHHSPLFFAGQTITKY